MGEPPAPLMPLQTNLEVAVMPTLNQTVDLQSNERISYLWIRRCIRTKHTEFRSTEIEKENILQGFFSLKYFMYFNNAKDKNCILKNPL